MTTKFHLTDTFVDKYQRKKTPFGFNGLGELVYNRTYSRLKDNGKNEQWWETVQRVVEAHSICKSDTLNIVTRVGILGKLTLSQNV